jgi:hypothetical protein
MAVDKGIMRKALLRAKRFGKKGLPFKENDLGVYHGGIVRMRNYGIIKKNPEGEGYVLANPTVDPVLEYKQKAGQWRRGPRKPRESAAAKEFPRQPEARIIHWDEGQFLIIIRGRKFLATEVAMVTRKRGGD